MKFFELKLRVIAPLIVVCCLAGVGSQVARAQSPPAWAQGDVFAGIGNGVYEVYHNVGTATSPNYVLVDTRNLGTNDFTTGCTFDLASNLYTTSFNQNNVVKFDANSPHSVLQIINTTGITPVNSLSNESVVFAGSGDFFVGHADPDHQVHRYNAAGTFQQAYAVDLEDRGSDWIDLSSDQHTLFYTSEGRLVKRFDLSTSTQLTNFANLGTPVSGETLFALRLLPPGDGSTGLLAANGANIKRFDASGIVIQTYTATGENFFFALNLDPDGTSFWAGGYVTGKLYKFDIASGGTLLTPIGTGATGTGTGNLAGICVKGQSTAVNTFTTPQQDITVQTVTFTDPGVMDQSIQFPNGTNRNGAAFMSVSFTNRPGSDSHPHLPLQYNRAVV